jgi:hypothetical protein
MGSFSAAFTTCGIRPPPPLPFFAFFVCALLLCPPLAPLMRFVLLIMCALLQGCSLQKCLGKRGKSSALFVLELAYFAVSLKKQKLLQIKHTFD